MAPLTYQIGRVRVHLISDGVFWTDGGGVFGVVPRVLWEKVIQPDALNRIPMDLRCLLIESGEGLILVDTGYGTKLPPKWLQQLNLTSDTRLLDNLAAAGFTAADVRLVINTHLHAGSLRRQHHSSGRTDSSSLPFPTRPISCSAWSWPMLPSPTSARAARISRRTSCRW